MRCVVIRFAKKEELKDVSKLSKMFASENCCNGIVADSENYYLDKTVAVAIVDSKIVGYAYGKIETVQKEKSYAHKGELMFYLEEMYVVPEKRNLNIGEEMFNFLEDFSKKQGVSVLELNAVSKDYLKLLDFYINKLNMTFFSAYLYKKI